MADLWKKRGFTRCGGTAGQTRVRRVPVPPVSPPNPPPVTVDAVLIGRNEGARLAAGLAALVGQVRRVASSQ